MSKNAPKVLYFTRHCVYTPQSLPTPLKPLDGQSLSDRVLIEFGWMRVRNGFWRVIFCKSKKRPASTLQDCP